MGEPENKEQKVKAKGNVGKYVNDVLGIRGDLSTAGEEEVRHYIWKTYIAPKLQKIGEELLHVIFFGTKAAQTPSSVPADAVSYNGQYTISNPSQSSPVKAFDNVARYKTVRYRSEQDAQIVLTQLKNICNRDGFVRVAKMLELSSWATASTDYNYGWRKGALNDVVVIQDTNGWRINLPEAVEITT